MKVDTIEVELKPKDIEEIKNEIKEGLINEGFVEVVRCKDCKWNGAKDEDEGDCAMMEYKHNGDDYCSYGERKGNE